jgi:hypothetical protein
MTTDKATLHKYISYIKSVIRLIGYVFLPISLPHAAIALFISEILGILEEVFGA